MIQRLQTIFLILAVAANFSTLFLNMGDATLGGGIDADTGDNVVVTMHGGCMSISGFSEAEMKFMENEAVPVSETPILMAHMILVILNSLALLAIVFLYKDRQRQMKVTYFEMVMLMLQIALAAVVFMQLPDAIGGVNEGEHNIGFGFFLPVVAMLFAWLAVKRIQKDEKMVRDSDRLR